MKLKHSLILLAALVLISGEARAQLEQDTFEKITSEGVGRDRKSAIDSAKRKAVFDRVIALVKEKDLEEYSEDRVGVKDVLRNSAQYLAGREKPLETRDTR
ncbi:MAG: hypothetical protein ACYTFG_20075 [Planctomycetota bacterium]